MPGNTILVVDDDAAIRETIADVLEFEGYSSRTAANGKVALDLIALSRPDAILLDLQMPGLNGWDVARELKTRGSRIPIVVMTADGAGRRWADQIHARGFVAKPFSIAELLDTVEHACSSRS